MPLVERHGVPALNQPVLVVALDGWIDAGFAASTAAATLLEAIPTEPYATFDGEELIDYRARRPRLRIDDGVRGPLAYSEPRLLVGTDALGGAIALLVGPEPDYHWRAFADEVAGIAVELEARLVVSLGAFPNGVPHTRPVRLAATASDAELARRVGYVPGSIEVPAGIGDVIGIACSASGIPSTGLWARVPHYVAGMPFTPGALALLEGLSALTGLAIDLEELRSGAEAARRRVDDLIAASDEHSSLVRRLEEAVEEAETGDGTLGELAIDGRLPSGDEIAAELERFLHGEL